MLTTWPTLLHRSEVSAVALFAVRAIMRFGIGWPKSVRVRPAATPDRRGSTAEAFQTSVSCDVWARLPPQKQHTKPGSHLSCASDRFGGRHEVTSDPDCGAFNAIRLQPNISETVLSGRFCSGIRESASLNRQSVVFRRPCSTDQLVPGRLSDLRRIALRLERLRTAISPRRRLLHNLACRIETDHIRFSKR